jgi:hypothetical protein
LRRNIAGNTLGAQAQPDAAPLHRELPVNPVVYAELTLAFQRIEELEPAGKIRCGQNSAKAT